MHKILFIIIALFLLSALGDEPATTKDSALQAKECREAHPMSWEYNCNKTLDDKEQETKHYDKY
jgi:hypothetical protein